ncbi:alpha-L-fucosidase [Herbaspirillum sp. NPDC087042]|uniref:alpha-L-fucosidase n=1 Tax=Herbaspirillum sp. NPDC087042 TaxID=3364004 RepID=UPI0037F4AF69
MSANNLKELVLPQSSKDWFVGDRFGMFIHFGLYALPARHEWVQSYEEITGSEYRKYFENFNPDLYDPREWARKAREAGMKYVVLTAKHHDGFCLFDSAYTDYKSTNTPYGKDLLQPFVEAFRAEGLRIGFYYSLIDWHHPDFTIDVFHPDRNHPDVARLNEGRDMKRYALYMRNQVTELLSRYGEIDILWFDFSYAHRDYKGLPGKGRDDWQSEELLKHVRSLQPDVIINNRLDLIDQPGYFPDITTPEQYQPRKAPLIKEQAVTWESCHTFSGSWGYFRDEDAWKSPEQLIKLLINTVALNGNLLMNVGPTGRGTFDHRADVALSAYGDWMKLHGRAIYGAEPSELSPPEGCRFTQKGNRLYLHVMDWPFRHIHLDGMAGKIAYAQFLHDASEVRWLSHEEEVDPNIGVAVPDGSMTLELPVRKPNVIVPVIEIVLSDR